MPKAPSTILGGLPVFADVSFGYDEYIGESWSEVNAIYWRRRNGKPGKEISQALYDKAQAYDPGLYQTLEQACEYIADKAEEEKDNVREPEPGFALIGRP